MSIFTRPKIGLALGSGGARGLAHIGVIKTLKKYKIPIDFIAGSSAGSLIGGMYAALRNIKKIEKIAYDFNYRDFLSAFTDPSIISGLFKGTRAINVLEKYIGKKRIEELKIPFSAVATDIITGKTEILNTGSLAKAIRASSSVPFLFKPIRLRGKYLVDGGTAEPVPVKTVRKMGADKVIAVNLNESFFPKPKKLKQAKKLKTITILKSSLELLEYHLAKENVKDADVVINPKVPDVPLTKLVNGEELISIGEKSTEILIDKIRKLVKSKFLFFPI